MTPTGTGDTVCHVGRFVAIIWIVLAVIAADAHAASCQDGPLTFAVASVKVSPPLPPDGARVVTALPPRGGRWVAQNAPLIDILRTVYPEHRLRGQIVAPDWVQRTRFDIDARAEGEPSRPQMIALIKQLLADRFAMKAHIESREIDVQVLTLARADRRLGPALRPSSIDCEAVAAARARGESPQEPEGRPFCIAVARQQPDGLIRVGGAGALIGHVIAMIQGAVREPVVDRTNLTGQFDVDFEFNPELDDFRPAPADARGSSVATSLREQLGLRLVPDKTKVPVFVIDHIERPTEN